MDLALLLAGGEVESGECVGVVVAAVSGEGECHNWKLLLLVEHVDQ